MDLAWTASPVWLAINALVAFRLTRLWIDDMVPPLPRLREAITRRAHRDSLAAGEKFTKYQATLDRYGQPPLTYLVDCYWCAGFWISLGTMLAATFIPAAVWTFVAIPLALSALVGLLGRLD